MITLNDGVYNTCDLQFSTVIINIQIKRKEHKNLI